MVKQKRINIVTEGRFEDITPPDFKLFNISLKEIDSQLREYKTDKIISSDKIFDIAIDASKVAKSFINLLSDELKVAFSLSFAPFNRESKSYNFYITKNSGSVETRKNVLTGIFDTLKDFEKDYFLKVDQTKPIFEKAKEDLKDFQTDEFDVKFSHSMDTFVVVAKSFIGGDSFKKLANCSQEIGKVLDNQQIADLFENNKKYLKKSYFIISPNDYLVINDYIRGIKKNVENFLDHQNNFYNENKERLNTLVFDKPNVFDYKIKINEDRKCFEFFCKGFEAPSDWEGVRNNRNLLQTWALNFILSSPLSVMKQDEYIKEDELIISDFGKEDIKYQKDSSKKDKVYYVPFTEVEKIERVHQNYLKQEGLWGRTQFVIKHPCVSFQKRALNADLIRYPAVYLGGDGQAYLIFESRESASKKSNSLVINLKGVKITPDEFKELTTNHPFSESIENNTKFLNAQLWAGPEAVFNYNSLEKAYDDVAMAYRIHNSVKSVKAVKRLKI